MHGLEAREARLEWELAHDALGRPGKRATRACQVFAGHAVLSTDEGERRDTAHLPDEPSCDLTP